MSPAHVSLRGVSKVFPTSKAGAELHALGPVDLAPAGPHNLAATRGGQNGKFESPSGDAILLAQIAHQGADLNIWQRGVVRAARLGLCRLTLDVLTKILGILGIEVPQRM